MSTPAVNPPTNPNPAPANPAPSNPAPANPPQNQPPANPPANPPQNPPANPPAPGTNTNTGFGGQQPANPNTGFGGTNPTPPAAPAAVDPGTYTPFTLPEGVDVNSEETKALVNAFSAAAGRRGFTQEQAQHAMDIMSELNVAAEQHASQARVQAEDGYKQQSTTLGLLNQQTLMHANQALTTLDPSNGLRDTLNELGLMYHPALIQVFAHFANAGARPAMVDGGLSGAATPAGPVDFATAMGYRNK